MAYKIPQTEFDPHPEGEHVGTITEVRDQGMRQTAYGEKHKLTIIVESQTAQEDNGEPFQLWVWVTLSSGSKATLTNLRQKLLRRPLSDLERRSFDQEREMIGRRVRYFVEHNFGDDGRVFANLVTWAPLEQGQAARQARDQLQQGQNGNGQPQPPETANEALEEEEELEPVPAGKDDDLPF